MHPPVFVPPGPKTSLFFMARSQGRTRSKATPREMSQMRRRGTEKPCLIAGQQETGARPPSDALSTSQGTLAD